MHHGISHRHRHTGGYGPHFAEIGHRFGGFDLVALDTGQYDEQWPHIHMTPEQAAQAAQDLQADALLPGHIRKFSLARHAWDAPFRRITAASEGRSYRLLTPIIGSPIVLDDRQQRFSRWWEDLAQSPRFEDSVCDVDVVLDPLGADSHRRSFAVLKKGGILVALMEEPRQDLARESGVRATMIGVKPDGRRLADIGRIIDDGKLRPLVQEVLPLEHAKKALELSRSRHVGGRSFYPSDRSHFKLEKTLRRESD